MNNLIITDEYVEPTGRTIAVIRHGQTKLNAENKIRGWLDVPLDKTGWNQAYELGETMHKENIELDGIITSDLLRAEQTALAVSQETGIPILGTSKCFRPFNVGDFSGEDGEKVHKMIAQKAQDAPDEEFPNGESFNQFKFRFLTGLIGHMNSNRGLQLGFVSHSRGERLLNAWIMEGCSSSLEIDMETFLDRGDETATIQLLTLDCELILP